MKELQLGRTPDALRGQTLFVQTAAICSRASKTLVGTLTGEQYNVAVAPECILWQEVEIKSGNQKYMHTL